ncbi:MAG: NADAR family protein, partial [Bacteroidota bacterium]
EYNGETYQTAEHWMMVRKAELFNDLEKRAEILSAETPGKAKAKGREVRGFNQRVWNEERMSIVINGNVLKFLKNKDLCQFLLNTQERILVEASPVDPIWGIGLAQDNPATLNPYEWKGTNLLGFALMEVRRRLNQVEGVEALTKVLPPPWLKYPELDPMDMGWKMGYGEEYILELSKYFETLNEKEKYFYQLIYPAPKEWLNWYD